jgi:hypothetical protein
MRSVRSTAGRATATTVLAATFVTGAIGVIVVAPWITRAAAVHQADNWEELSNIGQAYGGVSAIVSGLALCGIVASLLLQRQQIRLTRTITARERHFELLKLGLADPELIIGTSVASSPEESRQWQIRNMWVAHWLMLWDTGSLSRPVLRLLFDDLFTDAVALTWWSTVGSSAFTRDRGGVFVQTATDAYLEAAKSRSVPPAPRDATDADGTAPRSAEAADTNQ